MISVKCPHCHVGLKVDEGKIPLDITSFKCPKCRQPIPVSLLSMEKGSVASESETVLIQPFRMTTGIIGKTKSTNFQNEKYKKIAFTHF